MRLKPALRRLVSPAPVSGIGSWRAFEQRIRPLGNLLRTLDRYPDAILVAGCQRSGTTALTRIIAATPGVQGIRVGEDDELDAALALAGRLPFALGGRAVFQITYLNDSVHEYLEHDDYRLVWVIRRPQDVVYSMLHNWERGALNRLFRACGQQGLNTRERAAYARFGPLAVRPFRRACLAYNGKARQLFKLQRTLGPHRLWVVDYDALLADRRAGLADLFGFLGLPDQPQLAARLRRVSVKRRNHGFDDEVERVCGETYAQCRRLLSMAPCLA